MRSVPVLNERKSTGSPASTGGVRGMELTTTWGTRYCSCKIRRARRMASTSVNLTSVRVLRVCSVFNFFFQMGRPGTHSTSNQFGVMMVASGKMLLYIGTTSGDT